MTTTEPQRVTAFRAKARDLTLALALSTVAAHYLAGRDAQAAEVLAQFDRADLEAIAGLGDKLAGGAVLAIRDALVGA